MILQKVNWGENWRTKGLKFQIVVQCSHQEIFHSYTPHIRKMWYPYVWKNLEAKNSWTKYAVMMNDRTRIQKKKTLLRENTDQSTKSDGVKSMNMLFIHKMERNLKHLKMTQTPQRYCTWIRREHSPILKPTISRGQWQVLHLITIPNSLKNCQHLFTPPKAGWRVRPILQ